MVIKKVAVIEGVLNQDSIIPVETIANNEAVHARFRKVADQLREEQAKDGFQSGKQLSPKVDDFLYAHCIMMHAAEACLIDQDTGNPILNKKGEPVLGSFAAFQDGNGKDSVKWESQDDILPYRNGNGDIFPEEDLLKAHKDWIGKPLCRDHMSSSVEGIRGIVVDTYYDPKFKRVHALFALDRKNYGELARKIEAGYATSVSMGTAVGRSICSECGNVATTEPEYCQHVKTKTCHGEVNKDLSPIELSIVVTGADPKAKIMTVLAALKNYENQVKKVAAGQEDVSVLREIYLGLNKLGEEETITDEQRARQDALVAELKPILSSASNADPQIRNKTRVMVIAKLEQEGISPTLEGLHNSAKHQLIVAGNVSNIQFVSDEEALRIAAEELGVDSPTGADVQTGLVSREIKPENELGVDSEGYKYPAGAPADVPQGVGPTARETPPMAFSSLYLSNEVPNAEIVANKIASLRQDIRNLENQVKRENIMTFADLKKAQTDRTAYWQGTEEPTPGTPQYPLLGDQDAIREKDDKQMLQDGPLGGMDGLVPGDEETKRQWQRMAELKERMAKRAQWLKESTLGEGMGKTPEGKEIIKDPVTGDTYVQQAADGKTAAKKEDDDKDEKKDEKEDDKKAPPFGKKDEDDKDDKDEKKEDKKDDDDKDDDKKSDKESLLDFARALVAQAKDDDEDKDKAKAKKDKEKEKADKEKADKKEKEEKEKKAKKDGEKKDKAKKEAYWQGTEEPKPGTPHYPKLSPPDQDVIREKDDKHMLQDGPLGGMTGSVPGDDQLKAQWQRTAGKLGAKLFKGATSEKSRWEFSQAGNKLFSLSAEEAYGNFLNDSFTKDSTYGDLFHSRDYGTRVMKMLRNSGLEATVQELGVTLVKTAQDPLAAPAPAAAPAPPAEEGALPDEGAAPEEEAAEKTPEDKLKDVEPLIAEMEEVVKSIMEAAGTKPTPQEDDLGEVDVASGEEIGGAEGLPPAAPAVEPALGAKAKDLLEAYAAVSDATNELCYIEAKAREGKQDDKFYTVAEQAVHDAKLVTEEAKAVVAKAVEANHQGQLAARAKAREDLVTKGMPMPMPEYEAQAPMEYETKDPMEYEADAPMEGYVLDEGEVEEVEEVAEEVFLDLEKKPHEEYEEGKEMEDDYDMAHTMTYSSLDATGRKAWREGLVAEAKKGGQWDDIYTEQRSGGGHTLEGLGMTVSDNGDKVETEDEIHAVMEGIATKPLGKIREAAEKLDKWIKSGGININKLDMLVAEGAVDSEVVSYWKKYYGEVEGGREWASQLVSDFDKGTTKKASLEAIEASETRLHRSYALGLEAQKKAIIGPTQSDLTQYVETLKAVPEESFNALKNHVALLKGPQQLVSAPLVGLTEKETSLEKEASGNNLAPTVENLAQMFGG